MTAIGLLVAVPAVFAYNWLQNRNKKIAELLSAFSTDVLANINSRGAVKPAVLDQDRCGSDGEAGRGDGPEGLNPTSEMRGAGHGMRAPRPSSQY